MRADHHIYISANRLRQLDLRIMTWCWLMFLALDLNRRNINRAISDDMLAELGMTTNDFNTGQTIFLLSFLAAELPSGLISKKLGPDIWIPFIITAWSLVSASQAGLTNKAGYYACRCLLGLLCVDRSAEVAWTDVAI